MPWLLAPLGVMVTAWALTGCGGDESGVVAAEGNDGAEQVVDVEAQQSTALRIETIDTDAESSQSAEQSDRADAAAGVDDGATAAIPSPEDVSTGPILQWTEIEFDAPYGIALYATSDGRIAALGGRLPSEPFAGASHLLVTQDGAAWTRVPLPHELYPFSFDMSDQRAAVSGVPLAASPIGGDDAEMGVPTYISGDQGATWTEAKLDIQAARRELHDDATVELGLTSVYVSGEYVLVAAQGRVRLDVASLLVDAGLVAADARIARWESVDNSVRVWLDNSDGTEAEFDFAHDELALTDSQIAMLSDERHEPLHGSRVLLFGGSGPELAAVASFDGWLHAGNATEDGFRLILSTGDSESLVTSPDGESWSVHPLGNAGTADSPVSHAFAGDGTVWTVRFSTALDGGGGSSIHRWRVGEQSAQTASFPSIDALAAMAAGPPGLVVTGVTGLDQVAEENEDFWSDGRVTKEGYELRVGEPEGGLTLWDLSTRAAVYAFGPEVVGGSEAPPGVRIEGIGDLGTMTFEDPESGEDLVTFTMEELLPVLDLPTAMDSDVPDAWVGWSADGVRWGWESAQDAFDLGDEAGVPSFAVGSDFVVAMVTIIPPLEFDEGTDFGSPLPPPRWFIARVP